MAAREGPEALEGLGTAAWWLDDADTVFTARERAYALYRQRGDRVSAARLAIALAEDALYFRGEPVVARGWRRRAAHLLEGAACTPEQGWLQVSEGDFALVVDADPTRARTCAAAAAGCAAALGVVDLEMAARALEGAALVAEGRIDEGMDCLDEAAAAAVSGELSDPIAIGFSCCYVLNACERARDLPRAAQWCGRVQAFSKRTRFNALLAVCRCQYASVLIGRGEWAAAERELEASTRQLAASRPAMQGEALVRFAGLRRRQGRLAEAEVLLRDLDAPAALLERGAVALERGQARASAALARRYLRRVPDGNHLDRFGALEVLLQAEIAAGDRSEAARTLGALRAAGAGVASEAVGGSLALAEGLYRLAEGDAPAARAACEDGLDLFHRAGAPFDAARARLALARALRTLGDPGALPEAEAALEALQRLGAAGEARRATALLRALRPLGDRGPGRPVGPGGLSRREVEVLCLVAQGLRNQLIAAKLHVSAFTVKRHVQNILAKLDLPSRAAAAAYAARHGVG